ncbi:membrane protein [Rodentibacter pneumotropicus]|uniref:Membrane protein n=1 Tax=Rodentibacter pneumotropicus TaxID=758 RepID=A0A3S4U8X9_9PAST|nr:membrane protein [Rodentibacter pneumotropicus]
MRMSVIVGGGAFVVLIYRYVKKQNRQGIIVPMDSLAVLLGLILFSVIPLLINGTRDFQ